MQNATVYQPLSTVSRNSNPTIPMLQEFVCKANVVPFRCPCPPFNSPLTAQTIVVSTQSSCGWRYGHPCSHDVRLHYNANGLPISSTPIHDDDVNFT
ncbi:hypothetical protein TNCV_4918331 [Trichonephila clavipes]|nr:hypothetical protein TNCV_4918331 [Trichonephila clavipes]